ncbi:branched-chain amino acid ABC transporter permease [Kandleria sp.]|uniref:branched-chain amino acid ABC transporter permease n=1 Tax=Kandleria sp. TaxID=2774291 RepID=UPI001B5D2F1B|nr:branched-chain amino acid ABC transporter permease [Kandleria sp.]MBP3277297.1 branched-chain amino acid ABC transporter permease [Kandleria sp.]
MDFINQIINGLSTGSMYALVAIGYTMVYGIGKMINFAHGEIIMASSYFALVGISSLGLPPVAAIALSVVLTAALGVITEKVAYKPLRGKGSLEVLITAIGVSYLLQNVFYLIFTSSGKTFPDIMPQGSFHLGGLHITYITLITLIISGVCTGALLFFIHKTKMGKAMRAVSEDAGAAQLMGINVSSTISLAFAIGSGLGAVAGVIYGAKFSLINPYIGAMLGIKAFIAAVLGGIGSIPGAMVGGLMIGVAESLTISYISSDFSDAIVFGILILILLIKPAGLFGKNVREKV